MTKKFTYSEKHAGDQLTHTEWNNLAQDVDAAVDAINNGGGGTASTVIDTNGVISVSSKGNVTVGSNKNVNIEPAWDNNTASYSGNYGDIALKSGDDIQFCSHHREPKKRDKVVVKNIDGSDNPVKLQVVAGELDLAVGTANNPKTATRKKDKNSGSDISAEPLFKSDDAKVMDVRILTGETLDSGTNSEREERGYLKVRAQAIDLRCEKHGGIALQPKGYDSDGNMNKIKFEHGGGDGLEFGTFNAEKTSIFTDEYRFNREGIWKMSNRTTEPSGKTIVDEIEGDLGALPATGALKYKKNTIANNSALATQTGKTYESADDFYDFIDTSDEQCKTKDIIKTAYAMNGGKDRHTKITNKGAVEIATNVTYQVSETSEPENHNGVISVDTISQKVYDDLAQNILDGIYNEGDFTTLPDTTKIYTGTGVYITFTEIPAPAIKIESGGELKLGGVLDFGSSFNFGETDNGIEVQYKLTKKNNPKDCGVLKVIGINNSTTNTLTITTASPSDGTVQDYVIPVAEQTISANTYTPQTIASCSINDIIMFVNWAKGTGFGPWSSQAIADKEELEWVGNGFTAVTQVTPGENPTVG